MSSRSKPGLWVIEAEWSSRVTDIRSISPVLDALEHAKVARFVHRRVDDRDALIRELNRWGQAQHKAYGIGYVAMHGSPNSVHIGRRAIDLFDLAEDLPTGRLSSKVLHFGSCSVLTTPAVRRDLREALGVRAITGFREDVDWFESMAFELLLFDCLTHYKRLDAAEAYIKKNYGQLARRLGFVMERKRSASR